MRQRSITACVLATAALLAASCGRQEKPQAAAPQQPAAKSQYSVNIQLIAPLVPGKRTHATVDDQDDLYWSQEQDGHNDLVFEWPASGQTHATEFGTSSVLLALGETAGHGDIQSLAAGPDGTLLFYFAGETRRQILAALGTFAPRTGRVQILADTKALTETSGLGATLGLARGTLLVGRRHDSPRAWLWLRQSDQGVLLHFDPQAALAGSALLQRLPPVNGEDGELPMTGDTEDLSIGPRETLLYIDRHKAALWQIEATGHATLAASLLGVPDSATAPAYDDQGRMLILAGDTRPMGSLEMLDVQPPVSTRYPALLILQPSLPAVAVAAEDFQMTGPNNIQMAAFVPGFLVPQQHGGACVTYDSGSGDLLQLTVTAR